MTKIIAEIGLTHEGSLGNAMALVEAAAFSGADAVKFQHHVDGESTSRHGFRCANLQDSDRNAYWKRTGFTVDEWNKLIGGSRRCGIEIGITLFSMKSFNEINHLPWDFWKIGSGEWDYDELIDACVATRKPVYISNGMLQLDENVSIRDDVKYMRCVSEYPTELDRINVTHGMGLSDHSGTIYPSLMAIAFGSPVVEVHVCFHKQQFGPDIPVSITFDELATICEFRDAAKRMGTNPPTNAERAQLHAEYRKNKCRPS